MFPAVAGTGFWPGCPRTSGSDPLLPLLSLEVLSAGHWPLCTLGMEAEIGRAGIRILLRILTYRAGCLTTAILFLLL